MWLSMTTIGTYKEGRGLMHFKRSQCGVRSGRLPHIVIHVEQGIRRPAGLRVGHFEAVGQLVLGKGASGDHHLRQHVRAMGGGSGACGGRCLGVGRCSRRCGQVQQREGNAVWGIRK